MAALVVLAGCGGDDDEAATTQVERPSRWAIAFVRDGTLVLRSSDGGGGAPITRGSLFRQVVDRNPAFSPDGKRIAFVSDRGDEPQDDLYVLATGGAEPRRLTSDTRIELEPTWVDNDTVAFVSCTIDFGACELAQVRATGGGRKLLRKLDGAIEIDVARETQTLVYSRAAGSELELDLFTEPLAGGRGRRLTREPGRDHEPAVSRDGRIAFASDGAIAGSPRDIVVVEPGRGATHLTDDPRDDAAPAWSPDGERIAWVRTGHGGAGGADAELWVMNADGTCAQALTSNDRADVHPAWDPRYAPGPIAC